MKRYILKIRRILCCSVVLSIVKAVINALMLLFPGWLIDGFSKGLPYIVKLLAAYTVLFVLYLINAYFSNRAADYRRINFEKAIKKDFFDAVIQRDFQSFHKYDVAEYISMQTNDISEMCMNYMNPLFFILDAAVMIAIFGTSLVIFVNINIALIILLFSALIVFVPRLTANNLAKRNGVYLENVGQYTSTVKTLYEAHAILDRKGRKKITQLHGSALDHVMNLFNHFRRLNSFAMVLNGGSVELISLVVFAVVAILLCNGSITVGMATIAFTYSTKFMEPIYQLNTSLGDVLSVRKIQAKLLEIIHGSKPEIEETSDIRRISTTELEKKYENAAIHIPSVNMLFPKKYLVVGENGVGKSVFFRLLMHFEEADIGTVLYNDQEQVAGIAESICYVPQAPILFQSSYEDNVTIYHTYDSSKLSKYESIFPPEILNHIKGCPDLRNLSGGEKQVIAILRALCSEKPIILMDEPFAAMNQVTINSFMKHMNEVDRMMVIIAHNADEFASQFDDKILIQR